MSSNDIIDTTLNSDTDVMVDNYVTGINNDKFVLFTIVTLLSIYSATCTNSFALYAHDFLSSPFFQIGVFIIICYITPLSPALGMCLALAILVTLQAVRDVKIKTMLDNFGLMDPFNMNNQHESYLTNPLQKATTNVPTTDLRLVSLESKYDNMIKEGRNLLEDSNELKNDLQKRPDEREQKIADVSEIVAKTMIQSGINRLSGNDDGQIETDSKPGKFVKYDKSMATNNHEILSKYNELQHNFDNLKDIQNNKEFEEQFNKAQKDRLELIQLIYRNKKETLSKKKQEKVNAMLDNINNPHSKEDLKEEDLKELERLLV